MPRKKVCKDMHECKTCIHMESALMRIDGKCMPQVFLSNKPTSVYHNIPCRFYDKAPEERIINGPFGTKTREIWDKDRGSYIPKESEITEKKHELTKEQLEAQKNYENGKISFFEYICAGINFD